MQERKMKIPSGCEQLFLDNPAKVRWLELTDLQLVPWPDPSSFHIRPLLTNDTMRIHEPIGNKRNPDGGVNYEYLDAGRWWESQAGVLGQGWVRNERFGSGVVIPGTNRAAQRKARA